MYGTYISATGADTFDRYLEVISNNIANVDTPGFRRELPVVKAYHSEAIEQGLAGAGDGSINDVGGGIGMFQTVTSFETGRVKQTGINSDLMLADPRGDHFFVVNRDGEQMLTRAGNFNFDAYGTLRTQSGDEVLNSSGGPIQINPNVPYQFGSDGTVFQPLTGERIQLAVVRPGSLDDLKHAGSNLFSTSGELTIVGPDERSVRPGYLEVSSARPVQEMVDMIQVTRAYEANLRMIQQQDGVSESLISRVLGG